MGTQHLDFEEFYRGFRDNLFFGYFNSDHASASDLIYTSSYTCNGQPSGGPAGS